MNAEDSTNTPHPAGLQRPSPPQPSRTRRGGGACWHSARRHPQHGIHSHNHHQAKEYAKRDWMHHCTSERKVGPKVYTRDSDDARASAWSWPDTCKGHPNNSSLYNAWNLKVGHGPKVQLEERIRRVVAGSEHETFEHRWKLTVAAKQMQRNPRKISPPDREIRWLAKNPSFLVFGTAHHGEYAITRLSTMGAAREDEAMAKEYHHANVLSKNNYTLAL